MKKAGMQTLISALVYLTLGSMSASADSLSGTFSSLYSKGATYYAVYIINQAGDFVKTLRVWGVTTRDGYWDQMDVWPSLSNKNIVDAVTGATVSAPLSNAAFKWNGTDVKKTPVAKGSYSLVLESVKENNNYRILKIPFILDGNSKTVPRSDTNNFKAITINIIGGGSSTRQPSVKTSSPTAVISLGATRIEIAIPGNGPVSLDIFTLSGSRLLHQNFSVAAGCRVNIAESVNPGIYLMKASTKQGSVQQKVLIGR